MNNKLDSAALRQRLEDHLIMIFATNKIGKYLAIDSCGPEMQILGACGETATAFSRIKLAYGIWLGMTALDRHTVLGKFQHYYTALPVTGCSKRKTLMFCALFIHEFSMILAEAME